jgi:drug/metabolite transporter (DMT)-like permease
VPTPIHQTLAFNTAATVTAFGLAPLLKRMALVDGVGQWTVALFTAVFAGLVSVVALALHRPRALPSLLSPRYRYRLLLLGVVASGIVTLLVVQALTVTTATNRSLFQSAYPAATLVFAHLLLGERLRVGQYLAIVAMMVGLLFMNGSTDDLRIGTGFWLLLATLPLIGLSDVYGKRWSGELSPAVLAAGRNLYGALFVLGITPSLGISLPGELGNWLVLAAAGTLQGTGVWTLYRALEATKATLVATMVAASPLLTLIAEHLLLGVELDALQWSGFVVVLTAAIWLATGGRSQH